MKRHLAIVRTEEPIQTAAPPALDLPDRSPPPAPMGAQRWEKNASWGMVVVVFVLSGLIFSWATKQVETPKPRTAAPVMLWNELPAMPKPEVPPPAKAKPATKKAIPKAVPKTAPKIASKPVVKKVEAKKPQPKPAAAPVKAAPPKAEEKQPKPDIALQKLEKEQVAEKEKQLSKLLRDEEGKEEKKLLEARLAAEKRELEAKKAAEALALKQGEEQERLRGERVAQLETEARKARARRDLDLQKYLLAIQKKIQGVLVEPPGLSGDPRPLFEVQLGPRGEVLGVRLEKPSNNPAYDQAAQAAIHKASPLFEPDWDQQVRNELRPLRLFVQRSVRAKP